MPASLENLAMVTGLEKVSFHSIPKKDNAKKCSNYHITALISHASKVMLKILQDRLPDVQAGFRKGRGTGGQIANIHWILEKTRGSPPKKSTSASLTIRKTLTVWITTNWKILIEMEIPDHLTCLLRNLYVGQEVTVRTRHGIMDWFKTGKGICQDCTLSPCLFNLYVEYITQNIGLDKSQAGIKLAGEISITSDMQMTPLLWQKAKRN